MCSSDLCAGVRDEGYAANEDLIESAMWTSMLVRSGFDSLRYDWLAHDAASDHEATFAARVELTRRIAIGASKIL